MVTEITGTDNKVRSSSKYDILSVDLSRSKEGQCHVWTSLGMEFFEFFILGILTIFLAYKTVKKCYGKEGFLQKRKDANLQRDQKKFTKLKLQFERPEEMKVDEEKGNSKGPTIASIEGPVTETHTGAMGKPVIIPFVFVP